MKRTHTLVYALLALLVVFVGTFALRSETFGKGSSGHDLKTTNLETITTSENIGRPALKAEVGIRDFETVGTPLFTLFNHPSYNPDALTPPNVLRLKPLPPTKLKAIDSETLWLARAIFSETKRPQEQELVAWVIRNRVETRYRGKRTYRDAVLDPYQFSAFNPGSRKRSYFTSLSPYARARGWQRALRIAYEVRHMPTALRPFAPTTRHFFSQRSMAGGRTPSWARSLKPVVPARDFELDPTRFKFFASVS